MADAKAPTEASSTPKDKKKKEVGRVKEKQLVLTPSEKALGIRITQPKQKTIDTMSRLYAVPSEKLRVWTCWLTKVGERADDWQWWLRAQIGLVVRISEHLQRAVLALEAEEITKMCQGDGSSEFGIAPKEDKNNAAATEMSDYDLTGDKPKSPEEEKDVAGNNVVPEVEPGDTQQPVEVVEAKKSERQGDKKNGKNEKKTKGKKLEPKIVYKEGFWPVGVRWKPLSQRGEQKPPPKRQPDKIPIPGSEEEMIRLVKTIRHQTVVYRSLYKHWSETADQAAKEMVGRTVLPTKQVYLNGEDVPYFFYLEAEPDIDYVIEHDDEDVLLPDPNRENITHQFTHLYFNLSDKPGKGGKPWL